MGKKYVVEDHLPTVDIRLNGKKVAGLFRLYGRWEAFDCRIWLGRNAYGGAESALPIGVYDDREEAEEACFASLSGEPVVPDYLKDRVWSPPPPEEL